MQPSEADESPDLTARAASAVVLEDVLCTGCGYDLRRLPIDTNCPECGRTIRESLEGHRLGGADPKWLKRITRGAGLLAWGWALVVFSPIAMFALGMSYLFLFVTFRGRFPEFLFGLAVMFLPLCFLAGLVLVAAGAILITMLDPRESLRETTFSTRRLARLGMIGAVAAYLATMPVAAVFRITVAGQIAAIALAGAMLISITVGIVALLRTLAVHVGRVPDPKHATRLQSAAKFFTWALPITIGFQLVANLVVFGTGGAGGFRFSDFVPCIMLVLWFVIIVRAVHVAVLLFQARRMIRLCFTQAQLQSQ